MYQPIEIAEEPVRRTIDFMREEARWFKGEMADTPAGLCHFTMAQWCSPVSDQPGCGTTCCIGGSMIIANGWKPALSTMGLAERLVVTSPAEIEDVYKLEGILDDLFHPADWTPPRKKEEPLVHWGMTRKQAIHALEGILDKTIGYSERGLWHFGYVDAGKKAA